MIALAIESSNSRGMGHLFRSLLFVDYMKKNNLEFVYLINDDKKSLDVLKKKKIKYEVVDYYDHENDWEGKLIDDLKIDIWINDKFETSTEMVKKIKNKGVYFALIDDIGLGEKEADVNFIGLIYFSKKEFNSSNSKMGMEYVVLNEEIYKNKRLRSELKRIIVSFGGSDPNNNTMKIVKELLKYQYPFDITIGPNYQYEKELRELVGERAGIYQNVPSLIEFFSNYDLAITGGGITCCEANAAGLPCIIIANVPHEVNTGRNLEKYGGCIFAGDYEKWDTEILKHLPELDLSEMSKKGMEIFDTKALDRIFGYIFENVKGK